MAVVNCFCFVLCSVWESYSNVIDVYIWYCLFVLLSSLMIVRIKISHSVFLFFFLSDAVVIS